MEAQGCINVVLSPLDRDVAPRSRWREDPSRSVMASDVPFDGHRIRDQGAVHVGNDQPSGIGNEKPPRPTEPATLATAASTRSSMRIQALVYQLGLFGAPLSVVSTKTDAAVDGGGATRGFNNRYGISGPEGRQPAST
jgi:hypothetical protein